MSDQTTTDLAEAGYTEAIHLMAAGKLNTVRLWRPEALNRYREALRDGTPDPQWMERFNGDLHEAIGTSYSACFIGPEDEHYPTIDEINPEDWPVAVIKLSRGTGENTSTATFIVRPEADQVLKPIMRVRFTM